MVPEAPIEATDAGLVVTGDGWFVIDARETRWAKVDGLGACAVFQGESASFTQLGINLNVLAPGEPMSMYHAEEAQEDFLVLMGECLLIVEGRQRLLRAWDFVHCPAWTEHVFVGAGDGPCVLIAVGARSAGHGLRYPVNDLALAHGAGVERETSDPREAYARFPEPRPIPCPPVLRAP